MLRMERRLAHPPERVWSALVEADRLATWFPSGATIEPRVGGKVVFGFGGDGVVTDLDPPRLIAFTWETDHLRFELSPDGDGSLLLLVHTFDDRAGAASFAAGWDSCLAVLDGAGPVDHRVLHERYVEELGLSEPAVTGTAQAWEVRVERQLVHPVDEVRAVLDGEPWEFLEGTGHGARVRLVRSGAGAAERDRAVRDLRSAVTALVERLGGAPVTREPAVP
ncbi:SRPBCC family protein [Pseudonocardia petroleophila]